MGVKDFGTLVRDLRLGLRDSEVRHLFGHLAEDVAVLNKLPSTAEGDEHSDDDSLPPSRRTHTTTATTVCRYLSPASALSCSNASMAQPAMRSAKAQVDTRSFSAFRTATRLGGGVVLAGGGGGGGALAAGFSASWAATREGGGFVLAAEFVERRRRSTSTRAATPSSAAVTVVKDARDRIARRPGELLEYEKSRRSA